MRVDAPNLTTTVAPASPAAISEAAALIRDGKLVAFPTETVYGLAANALDDFAVSAIFVAKERPRFNPLIVHVLDQAEASEIVVFNEPSRALAQAFWPGPLTLVLPRREPSPLALLVSAGLETAAVRSPSHKIARALLDASGIPIAAPSANRSSRLSPTNAADVAEELRGRVSLVLDGGPSPIGVESTVVGFENEHVVLLRAGAVPRGDIEAVTGPLKQSQAGEVRSPGMLAQHYAPRAGLRLNASEVKAGEALLAFGADVPPGAATVRNLSAAGDLREAAANFFAMMRALDKSGASTIAVMAIPDEGLGEAINDRLRRAAARE